MPTKHKAKLVPEVLKLVNCCNLKRIKKLHQVINTIISIYLLHQRKTNRFSKKKGSIATWLLGYRQGYVHTR